MAKSVLLQRQRPTPECTCWTCYLNHHVYGTNIFMVHASLHWTEIVSDDLSIWSFEVKPSVQVYNHVPNVWPGLSPLNLWPGSALTVRTSYSTFMWGDVRCSFSKANLLNDQNFPSEIDEFDWVNSLNFQMNTISWWETYDICLPTSSRPNSMLFSMIYSK